VRYLYKIYSPYDGFYPARIPDRLIDGRFLRLGWAQYIDALHNGDEVWIVFTGPKVDNGVYVQGLVANIDAEAGEVLLRVRRCSTDKPLTDEETSAALRAAVNRRFRQVFLWPEDHLLQENCLAAECGNRQCLQCQVWNGLPQIDAAHYRPPPALRGATVVPAYWAIPARCYLYYGDRGPAPWNSRITNMFAAFKVGEGRYAFPFAAGIQAALQARGLGAFDAVVPIPLSPEKAGAGELDRTGVLATELARLLGTKVRRHLRLSAPISKRRMLAQGFTITEFRNRYRELLQVDPGIAALNRIILLDDAITRGSTVSVAMRAIREVSPASEIVAAAAVQMIIKDVVADENGPAW
jgi:predicted amidophosphoribosyltransferase